MLAQGTAGGLVQRLDVLGHLRAGDHAHRLDQPEGEAPRQPLERFVVAHLDQRLEQRGDLAVDEMLQTAFHLLGDVHAGLVVDKGHHPGFERVVPLGEFADRLIAPHQTALFGKVDLGVGGVVKAIRAQVEMRCKRLQRCLPHRLGLLPCRLLVLTEPEAFESPDEFSFDGHLTLVVYFGQEGLLLLQPAH